MKYIAILLSVAFSLGSIAKAHEPTAQFRGVGRVQAKPDFIKLHFTIRSECYGSPAEAQEETDRAVKFIHDFLKTLKKNDDKNFKIFVSGGYTSAFSRWYKDRELCRNTFQKDTQIELKIAMSDDFDKTFSVIQNHVLKAFTKDFSLDNQNPLTYVEIGSPTPQIEEVHKETLLREALNRAMLDAKSRFRAATKSCEPSKWKVMSVREEAQNVYVPMPRTYASSAKMSSVRTEMAAPVIFDDLKIEASLDVTFGFDGGLCYEAQSLNQKN